MERTRNELYYIERLAGEPMVLYPDGTVGKFEETETEVEQQVMGRRQDRMRKVLEKKQRPVQTAIFASPSEYLASVNKKREKSRKKYLPYGEDKSWSLADMPDNVIAEFESWKQLLDIPAKDEYAAAAMEVMVDEKTAQEATIKCPDCANNLQYACYSCGYARAYFMYPLVRLVSKDGHHDVPFDVARQIANDPETLKFEIRTRFDWQGKMAAEQVAVLNLKRISGRYLELPEDAFCIEKSDALHTKIDFTIASWSEDGYMQNRTQPKNIVSPEPCDLIAAYQYLIATKTVREQIDMPKHQEMYTKFREKMKKIGGASMAIALRGIYMGMGDHELELCATYPGGDSLNLKHIWLSSDIKWLLEDVETTLDHVTTIEELCPYLNEQVRRRYEQSGKQK